jgi:hypothetical protein
VLELAAKQLETEKCTKDEARVAIELVRTCKPRNVAIAMEMLNLSRNDVTISLNLMQKMKG